MRLIDADKALKIAESYGTTHGTTLGRHSGVADTIYDEIAKLPIIEAQPVRHGVWRLMHNSYDRAKEYNNSFFKGQRQNTLLCSCQLGDRRMPNKDEITTKFKVDISDLKKILPKLTKISSLPTLSSRPLPLAWTIGANQARASKQS